MPTVHPITLLTLCTAAAVGVLFGTLSVLKLSFARRPDPAVGSLPYFFLLQNALFLPLLLLAGMFSDSFGVRAVVIGGGVLATLALLLVGGDVRKAVPAVVLATAGAAGLFIGVLQLFPVGLFGERLTTASMHMGLVFVAVAALLTPPLFEVLRDALGLRRALGLLSLVLVAPVVLSLAVRDEVFPTRAALPASYAQVFAEPGVVVAAVIFFAYAPLEAFVTAWVSAYLTQTGQAARRTRWLAWFWGMLLLSRLVVVVAQYLSPLEEVYFAWIIVVAALLSAVVMGNMAGATRNERALPGLLFLGFFMGPIFPMLLGTLEAMPTVRGGLGLALAAVLSAGSLGSLALSPLVAPGAKARSFQSALRVPIVVCLVMAAAALVFAMS